MTTRLLLEGGTGGSRRREMAPVGAVYDPQYWRDRAENARSRAKQSKDARSKRMLQGLARAYERLANQAKRRVDKAEKVQR
jgi:hypothetical protein